MSAVSRAVLRADIRMILMPWLVLVLLQFVLLLIYLGYLGDVAPALDGGWSRLGSMGWGLTMASYIVVLPVLIAALWRGAPSRRGGFLGTRPVERGALLRAKFGLVLFVLAPFLITALIYPLVGGLPVADSLASCARMMAMLALCVVALWAYLWLWQSQIAAVRSVFLMAGVLVGGFALVQLLPEGWLKYPKPIGGSVGWKLLLGSALVGLLGLGFLNSRRRLAEAGLTAGLVIVILAALLVALVFPVRKVVADRLQSPSLMRVTSSEQGQTGLVNLQFMPAFSSVESTLATHWVLDSLCFDGDKMMVPKLESVRDQPGLILDRMGCDLPVYEALKREIPDHTLIMGSMVGSIAPPGNPWARVGKDELPEGGTDLDIGLVGHLWDWRLVGRVSCGAGAGSEVDGVDWKVRGLGERNQFCLSLRYPKGSPVHHLDQLMYFFHDPEEGVVYSTTQGVFTTSKLAGATGMPWVGIKVSVPPVPSLEEVIESDPDRLELLVLAPVYQGAVRCDWSGRLDLAETLRGPSPGRAQALEDLTEDDLEAWLADNPGPSVAADDGEIAGWIVAVLEKTALCRRISRGSPVSSELARYVPKHVELFLRALENLYIDQHRSRQVLLEALEQGLTRETAPLLLPWLANNSRLLGVLEAAGYLEGFAPELRLMVRSGLGSPELVRVLAKLPEQGGLRDDEILAAFVVSPQASSYRSLIGTNDLDAELDLRVDQLIAACPYAARDTGPGQLLKLGLARGDQEAPVALQRAIAISSMGNLMMGQWFANDISRSFVLPERIGEVGDPQEVVPWFLARPPSSFEFDDVEGKFELKKP